MNRKKTQKKDKKKTRVKQEKITQDKPKYNFVKKEHPKIKIPQGTHIFFFAISLVILSIIFSSKSMLLYAGLTSAAIYLAHFLNKHGHRLPDSILVASLFFVPIVITTAIFHDWLSIIVLIIYVTALITTTIIIYTTTKQHSFIQVMWQTTYSKIVASTAALIVLIILSTIKFNKFLTFFEVSILYILPTTLIFFFFSKIFYLHFFDKKHIKEDIHKSVKHSLVYTLLFTMIILIAYFISAAIITDKAMQISDHATNAQLKEIEQLNLLNQNSEISNLSITQDILRFNKETYNELSEHKNYVKSYRITFSEVIADEYFVFVVNTFKEDIKRSARIQETILTTNAINDVNQLVRTTYTDYAAITAYSEHMKDEFIKKRIHKDTYLSELAETINNPYTIKSYFEENGLFYLVLQQTNMEKLYNTDTIFLRQVSSILRQTRIFKESATGVLDVLVYVNIERSSPSILRLIELNAATDQDPLSIAIRGNLIMGYTNA